MAERKITGRVFAVAPMPARDALALYAELISVLGSAVHRLPGIVLTTAEATEGESEGGSLDIMSDIITFAAISDVVRTATPEGTAALVQRICEAAEIRTESGAYHPVEFDRDFTGHLKDIPTVVQFVLKEQFSDFFPKEE
jgi:hypothetical protein